MKKLAFLALLLVAVGTVQAQDVYQWFGGNPATTNWNDGYAWFCEVGATAGTFGVVPDAAAKVKLNNVLWGTPSPVIASGQNITIGDVFMVDAGHLTPEDLTVSAGGSLSVVGAGGTAAGQINIAYALGGTASVIVDGGAVNVAGPVHVGWGGTGNLLVNSGTITVLGLDFGGAGGTGHADVKAGTLNIVGVALSVIEGFVDDGLLTGYGSSANVVLTPDPDNDQVIVTAIPEPISIALMGLGALLIRRRS